MSEVKFVEGLLRKYYIDQVVSPTKRTVLESEKYFFMEPKVKIVKGSGKLIKDVSVTSRKIVNNLESKSYIFSGNAGLGKLGRLFIYFSFFG
jgi:hypothetical protein